MTVEASAKINLTLDILGKRDDGYHEVAMVMQSVGLFDTLHLEPIRSGIELRMDTAALPSDERNLAWRAARRFLDVHDLRSGVRIEIEKRIPIAAGLAGGSADAAAVLHGLDELFATKMTAAALSDIGAELGSDVPFCLYGGTMLATGRGEILTPLSRGVDAWIVLAKPPIEVSTAWAYAAFDDSHGSVNDWTPMMVEAIEKGDLADIAAHLGNALEGVTRKAHPVIGEYQRILRENGALASLMSGSGPTVYALSRDRAGAERAAAALSAIDSAAAVFVVPTTGPRENV